MGIGGFIFVFQKDGRLVGFSLQPIGASFFCEIWRRFCLRQGVKYKGTWIHLRHFIFARQKVSNVPEMLLQGIIMAGQKTNAIAKSYGKMNFESNLSVQRRIRAAYVFFVV